MDKVSSRKTHNTNGSFRDIVNKLTVVVHFSDLRRQVTFAKRCRAGRND
jgi:hypothetical protein